MAAATPTTPIPIRTSGPRLFFFFRGTRNSSGSDLRGLRPFSCGGGTSVPSVHSTSFTFGGDTTAASTTTASTTSSASTGFGFGLGLVGASVAFRATYFGAAGGGGGGGGGSAAGPCACIACTVKTWRHSRFGHRIDFPFISG